MDALPTLRNKFRFRTGAILVGLLLVVLGAWIQLTDTAGIKLLRERLDYLAYDLRLNLTLAENQQPHPDILIVDIDEESLQQEGRWPWSRQRLAELTQQLTLNGAAVISFDMVFAEPETHPAQLLLALDDPTLVPHRDLLEALATESATDTVFAQRLGDTDSVLGFFFNNDSILTQSPPHPAYTISDNSLPLVPPRFTGYTENISVLREQASQGFITVIPDADGVVRRVPLLIGHNDSLYPSLSLETARLFLLADNIGLDTKPIGSIEAIEHVEIAGLKIPTDESGKVLIPYRAPDTSFNRISARDILNGTISANQLDGRIVLVGTSAQALADLRPTPVQSVLPGVYVHAYVIAGILDNHFPYQPGWSSGLNLFIIILFGLLLAIISPILGPLTLISISFLITGIFLSLNIYLWKTQGLALDQVIPLFTLITIAGFNAINGFLFESQRRQQLKDMFGQYVPPPLVEAMNKDPAHYSLHGETREMSVLFADIRSFTSISESLSATELASLLNRYFTPMTEIIFNHRGTIDKYVGDMVMSFWGAPLPNQQHASDAIAAALHMLEATEALRQQFIDEGLPEIYIGIGINSGQMNVGDMGSQFRRAYTVLGDSVNLASRLEGTTKYYGVSLVVGERTRELAPEYLYRQLDRVKVKGKSTAVAVFEPIAKRVDATPEQVAMADAMQAGLKAFWRQDWDSATRLFNELAEQFPEDTLHGLYLDRIASLRNCTLPPDWDGVFERREK